MENLLLKKVSSLTDLEYSILDISSKYFREYGYYKSSVESIAKEIGIGKGTIYRHFGNKSNLLYYTFAFSIHQNFNILKKSSEIENCYEALNYYISEFINISKSFSNIRKSVAIEMSSIYAKEAFDDCSFIKYIMDMGRLYVTDILLPIMLKCTEKSNIDIDEPVISECINILIGSYCVHISFLEHLQENPSNIINNGELEMKKFIFRAIGISEDILKKYAK